MKDLDYKLQAKNKREFNQLEKKIEAFKAAYELKGRGDGIVVEKLLSDSKSVVMRPTKYSKIEKICRKEDSKLGKIETMDLKSGSVEIKVNGYKYIIDFKPKK
ncbi:MAG: hypothetical protein ABIB71_09320 [Candidatus Woesearchaeota archaeon]